jgi:hypothetical protein
MLAGIELVSAAGPRDPFDTGNDERSREPEP